MTRASEPRLAVATRPLTSDDWPVLEKLFGTRGGCGGCWCMSWRVPTHGKAWTARKGDPNRKAFRRLVESGVATGILAFAGGEEAVGWCSVGPREQFPRIEKSRVLRVEAPARTWVVTCFFIPREWRGRGVGGALLAAARDYAKKRGAAVLDGYPAKPPAGTTMPAAFAWTGVPAMFEKAGFRDITPAGQARPVFRFSPARR